MKKLVLLVVAVFAAACAAPTETTNREGANRNANTGSETFAALTEADAIAKEKQVWATLESKDYNAFGDMLDEGAILVTGDGVHNKPGIVEGVGGFVPKDLIFSDWKFLPIDRDVALITYRAKFAGTADGQEVPAESQYATTAWVNRNGKWLVVYHQDSGVIERPAPPPPDIQTPASPTPAASPGATSSDVEANEKLVWDALRNRHYDTFASYLAPEQIEVEPFGVFDKAGTVKGVQGSDLSKAELSDWKTLKLSDNASLVTYSARFPGATPERERHTTVWANRDGKWLAILHQGTQIRSASASPSPAR